MDFTNPTSNNKAGGLIITQLRMLLECVSHCYSINKKKYPEVSNCIYAKICFQCV